MSIAVKPADPCPPVPLVPAWEPAAVAGPTPTSAELAAAQERLDQAADGDAHAALTLATRLAQTAVADPATSTLVASALAAAIACMAVTVEALAELHGPCTVVGCVPCLRLTDARATAQAWKDGTT